ncbi:regulatory protein, luxR family [Roseateles sp. YR242]|uniref:helix-turn-helix domain-containing protein n=1 Tax=Roseateles sp. YR242 TaxID=1855305 RepID=UPI0008D2EBDD|nr:LuxR C-terminal-related transcriptional regulator [Roseateles sp. YR242]SEL67617.1 regulatory protein, luxR family [Roseateles sp. YR242]
MIEALPGAAPAVCAPPSARSLMKASALDLTGREVQLLGLLAQGWPNKRIAEHLSLTLGTTKQYLNRLFSKLGVENRGQAVQAGRQLELLS